MNKAGCFLISVLLRCFSFAFSQPVSIVYDKASPQAKYAVDMLGKALIPKGYTLNSEKSAIVITLSINTKQLPEEAYAISVNDKRLTITGGDNRGMIYGSLSLAEEIRKGGRLENIKARSEKPHYSFRAIKFDLPWDTYRHSDALDLHYETCRDLNYWKAFLDMMVENRLNSLTLWNQHPYTFMIKPKNFPEASPFTDAQLK
ncbi:MAG: hypothetical protein ICV51_20050, partial [Flavisolibacter sp.]|nr:hypothetical protein [Flavisolibacter sp.]